MVAFTMKELTKMIVANKRTNQNTLCNEHSMKVNSTDVYNISLGKLMILNNEHSTTDSQ